jgi:hypothetical protein
MERADSVWFWVLLGISIAGTVACWIRVLKSDDVLFFKVAGAVIAAIPFLGPNFFLFIDMPPRIPENAQAKLKWRVGTTLYTDIRRELFQGNRRYIGSVFGVRVNEHTVNREYRRATQRQSKNDQGN